MLALDPGREALRILVDRRAELARATDLDARPAPTPARRTHPREGEEGLTTPQTKAILASVRPRDLFGKPRRQPAAEQLADLPDTGQIHQG